MIEMICALGIFLGVSAAFYASSNTLAKLMQRLASQSEAASVFDNTVNRVANSTAPTVDLLTAIFEDEFNKSACRIDGWTRPVTTVRGQRVYLEIIDDQGRVMADIAFPLGGDAP